MTCLMAQPRYASDGQLTLPGDYREWIFLSSGLGMTYQPASAPGGHGAPSFTNVFVDPSAYRSFLSTGTWPDKTTLVLEVRASSSKGSINQVGSYQSEVLAVEAEVKDCYSCHLAHGAVDNTFVQFYPVLLDVAKHKGTFKR